MGTARNLRQSHQRSNTSRESKSQRSSSKLYNAYIIDDQDSIEDDDRD